VHLPVNHRWCYLFANFVCVLFLFFFFFCFQLKFISSSSSSDIVISTTTVVAVCPSPVVYERFNTNLSVC
jgi:phage-related minor tail protein